MARSLAIGTAIITALTLPVVVFADSRVDPQASSPAGAVYQIPLETARDFGAPGGGAAHGGGGSGGGGGDGGGGGVLPAGSAIKSENGYGSSAQVPGLSAASAKKARKAAAAHAAATGGSAATPGATASGSTASASSASSGAQPAGSAPRIDARRASDEAPSLTGTYGLVFLIAIGGAAAGIAASLAARASFGQRS